MGKYETWLKKWIAEQEASLKKGLPEGRIRFDTFIERIIQQYGRTPLRQDSPQDPLDRARLAVGGRNIGPRRKRPRNPKNLEEAWRLAMSQRRKRREDGFGRRLGG